MSNRSLKCRLFSASLVLALLLLLLWGGYKSSSTKEQMNLEEAYNGRYVVIGFDDFRKSDFEMVVPLLDKYGFNATFNRIGYSTEVSDEDRGHVKMLLERGDEVGDHTWRHYAYMYSMPLSNGQNPDQSEGNQQAYPSNDDMRVDRGDGKNSFGCFVNEKISDVLGSKLTYIDSESTWESLTDEQCQRIREDFSVMMDETGPINELDSLSNKYLGTTGKSRGSWDDSIGEYTGGIFTGCKTSANHEIWDRLEELTVRYYKDEFGIELKTWSLPGGKNGLTYERGGLRFYDRDCEKSANYNTKFKSSLTDENRSWVDVLRNNGYSNTHDNVYPGRYDGRRVNAQIKLQYIYNASQSRLDAVLYPTNRTINIRELEQFYNEDFFKGNKNDATQMYEYGGSFYKTIESIRMQTANGIIHGDLIDSANTYSERIYLKELMNYCKKSGIKLITKQEAYEICFNGSVPDGNLIYNPQLINTAESFFVDANNVPTNPDGYDGDCEVVKKDEKPILITKGSTVYRHYGIPLGQVRYSADMKGKGKVSFYLIKNNTDIIENTDAMELVGEIDVDSDEWGKKEIMLQMPNNSLMPYTDVYEGLDEKVIGLYVLYSEGLEISDIGLFKL